MSCILYHSCFFLLTLRYKAKFSSGNFHSIHVTAIIYLRNFLIFIYTYSSSTAVCMSSKKNIEKSVPATAIGVRRTLRHWAKGCKGRRRIVSRAFFRPCAGPSPCWYPRRGVLEDEPLLKGPAGISVRQPDHISQCVHTAVNGNNEMTLWDYLYTYA